jgi:hypothetical protein
MLKAIVSLPAEPDDAEAWPELVPVLLAELVELLQPARTAIDAHASRAIAPRTPADLVRR